MSRAKTQAPKGRNNPAQGNALGNAPPQDQSPEAAKEGGRIPIGDLTETRVEQTGPQAQQFTYVDIGSIDRETKRIVDPKVLPSSKAPSRAKQLLKTGDVLVSMTRPNLNAVAIVPPDLDGAIGSTGFHVLRARNAEPGFLFYAVQSTEFIDAMCLKVQGALYPAVRPRDISSFCIPFSSLEQQHRIVAEIEKQFTRLEAGVAALRRVQANLKRYRAAVLKAACEGRLVPTEAELSRSGVPPLNPDPTAKPAPSKAGSKVSTSPKRQDAASTFESGQQLLARILTERRQNWQGRGKYKEPASLSASGYEPESLPEGWTWATVSEVSAVIVDCPHSTAKFVSDGHPCLDTTCMKPGHVVREKLRYVTKATFDERVERLVPEANDIVFAREGTVGTAVAIPVDLLPCLGQRVMLMRPDACILPGYFQHCLNSQTVRRQYLPKIVGSTAPHINVAEVKMLAIPLPPLAEQTRIVAEVERRLSVVEELEAVVTTNLQRATRLRQAVLQKAFTGKLINQEAQ